MSPVRGLTDKPRQFPRIGKIRLGTQNERGIPRNQPFFVCPEEVQEVYGKEPTELKVVFISDDEENQASIWLRAYTNSNGLICKGDGVSANAKLDAEELKKLKGVFTQPLPLELWAHGDDEKNGRKASTKIVAQSLPCAGSGYDGAPPCPMYAAKKCGVRGFLQFAIRDVPGVGVYQLDTGSSINVDRILGALQSARLLYGKAAGVPMLLRRVQAEVAPDGRKKKVWTIEAQVDPEYSHTDLIRLVDSGRVVTALLPPVDESEPYPPVEEDDDVIEGEVVSSSESDECKAGRHDPAYNAALSVKACRRCGLVIEEEADAGFGASQEELSLDAAVAELTASLTSINTNPKYPAIYNDLSRFMPDGKSRFDPSGLLNQKTANEALQAVRNAVAGLSK